MSGLLTIYHVQNIFIQGEIKKITQRKYSFRTVISGCVKCDKCLKIGRHINLIANDSR